MPLFLECGKGEQGVGGNEESSGKDGWLWYGSPQRRLVFRYAMPLSIPNVH